jgi:hypothetical protein
MEQQKMTGRAVPVHRRVAPRADILFTQSSRKQRVCDDGILRRTALAVIHSAILDALKPLGVRDIAMPATQFAVRQAIQAAKSART